MPVAVAAAPLGCRDTPAQRRCREQPSCPSLRSSIRFRSWDPYLNRSTRPTDRMRVEHALRRVDDFSVRCAVHDREPTREPRLTLQPRWRLTRQSASGASSVSGNRGRESVATREQDVGKVSTSRIVGGLGGALEPLPVQYRAQRASTNCWRESRAPASGGHLVRRMRPTLAVGTAKNGARRRLPHHSSRPQLAEVGGL